MRQQKIRSIAWQGQGDQMLLASNKFDSLRKHRRVARDCCFSLPRPEDSARRNRFEYSLLRGFRFGVASEVLEPFVVT